MTTRQQKQDVLEYLLRPSYAPETWSESEQLNDSDNYYEFLKVILKKYNNLNENQKKSIIELLNILCFSLKY